MSEASRAMNYLRTINPAADEGKYKDMAAAVGNLTKAEAGTPLGILRNVGITAGLGAGIGAGAYGLGKGFELLHRKITERRNFRKMLEAHPDLQKHEDKARDAFKTMHKYAPDLTDSPQVAGAFVKRVLEYPEAGIAPATIRELVETQKGIHAARSDRGHFAGTLRAISPVSAKIG